MRRNNEQEENFKTGCSALKSKKDDERGEKNFVLRSLLTVE
jgi:hypothetical protein